MLAFCGISISNVETKTSCEVLKVAVAKIGLKTIAVVPTAISAKVGVKVVGACHTTVTVLTAITISYCLGNGLFGITVVNVVGADSLGPTISCLGLRAAYAIVVAEVTIADPDDISLYAVVVSELMAHFSFDEILSNNASDLAP